MIVEGQNRLITEMTCAEIIEERRRLAAIVHNCKYEKPEEINDLYEAYTLLIWKHHQVGMVYNCYYDAMANLRDGGADLEGSDQVVWDTLAMQGAFPNLNTIFEEIHAVGNPKDGFRFGQVVYDMASTKGGVSEYGVGTEGGFEPFECLEMCECEVKFAEGKWRMTAEWGVRSSLAHQRAKENKRPGPRYGD